MLEDKKIAIVCDWITDIGGAEKVLLDILELFPQADIFTSVYTVKDKSFLEGRQITSSFIQKIPFLRKKHKLTLFLRPLAFETFDLSGYDIVISSSSAESKGVITKPSTLHICYCHTPTRYFWSHYHEYLSMMEFGILNFFAKMLMPFVVHRLRKWDFVASARPDAYIANSKTTQKRIEKYYKRESEVIYPSIELDKFYISDIKKDYYFYVGRCIPYKKFDLLVETFNKNKKPLIIATNTDNKLYRKLKKKSKENIVWIFAPSKEELAKLYSEAKAFLFPPEEDFGLVPLEAMASGTPVIAYRKGGATETVKEGVSGVFFNNQTCNSINKAIENFEELSFDSHKIRQHASAWSKKIFLRNLQEFIEKRV